MLATNNDITFKKLSRFELLNPHLQEKLVKFLFHSLEQFRDPERDIRACLDYILHPDKGGYVFTATDAQADIKGVVFLTKTHMGLFVPEYLLVYIATDPQCRGKGVGKGLMQLVTTTVNAPVALHVEHDNPAKKLYEKVGFTNKYTEMRWYP